MNDSNNQNILSDSIGKIVQTSNPIEQDNNFQHGPCLICGKADASKTNSHLVPSFLVAMYSSYDNSGKRGKELQFSITSTGRSVHVGSIPDTKYEEIFDENSLEDEDLIKELMNDPNATDYVFCATCEKLLADYLEAPYADSIKNNKIIDGSVAYLFWLSVIWRMDACKLHFGFHLDDNISNSLHQLLATFFDDNGIINDKSKPRPEIFNYKLLYCPGFCKNTQKGLQYCNFKAGVLTFIIADFILVGYFGGVNNLPDDYLFESLRPWINQAIVNDGTKGTEQKLEIDDVVMEDTINSFKSFAVKIKMTHYLEIIVGLWRELRVPLPLTDQIIQEIIGEVFSEDLKLAERDTIPSTAAAIKSVLMKHGIFVR